MEYMAVLDCIYDADVPNKLHYTTTPLSASTVHSIIHSLPLPMLAEGLHDL